MAGPMLESVILSRIANAQYIAYLQNRIRIAETMEPADWQEAHSTTAPVMARIDATREAELTRRRAVDHQIWDAMTVEQEHAALEIRDGFEMVTGGIAVVTAQLGEHTTRTSNTLELPERRAEIQKAYWKWGRTCIDRQISHSAAMDVLFFGHSIRSVARYRHKRQSWARENLFDALTLYCALRGWAHPKFLRQRGTYE